MGCLCSKAASRQKKRVESVARARSIVSVVSERNPGTVAEVDHLSHRTGAVSVYQPSQTYGHTATMRDPTVKINHAEDDSHSMGASIWRRSAKPDLTEYRSKDEREKTSLNDGLIMEVRWRETDLSVMKSEAIIEHELAGINYPLDAEDVSQKKIVDMATHLRPTRHTDAASMLSSVRGEPREPGSLWQNGNGAFSSNIKQADKIFLRTKTKPIVFNESEEDDAQPAETARSPYKKAITTKFRRRQEGAPLEMPIKPLPSDKRRRSSILLNGNPLQRPSELM